MDVAGVRVLVAPASTAAALAAIAFGVSLGTCSGLVPGLHVNALALLLAAYRGSGVPEQDDPAVADPPRAVVGPGFAGSLAGAAVAYVPGMSGAIAAVFAVEATQAEGDRAFVAALFVPLAV